MNSKLRLAFSSSYCSAMNLVVDNRFSLHRRIGSGSFGEIYSGIDTATNRPVAVKLEPAKVRSPQLHIESRIYELLEGGLGIPELFYYGPEPTGRYNAMVIDLLGLSLEDLKVKQKRPISVKTVLMLADQMISCMEFVHKKHFVHRDIKPDNFMMGVNDRRGQVYVIDFGLSKRFEDPKTKKHISLTQHKSMTGTARYASINAMKGCEQSRRDDMESLAYVWLYLLRGSLPWQGLPARTEKEKMDKILHVKENTSIDVLCQGVPDEFAIYLAEARELEFTEEPPYSRWRLMFRSLFMRLQFVYDEVYDWTGRFDSIHIELKPIPATPNPIEVKPLAATQPETAKRSNSGEEAVSPFQAVRVRQRVSIAQPKKRPSGPRPNYHLVGRRLGTRLDGRKTAQAMTAMRSPREKPLCRNPRRIAIQRPILSFAERINCV